MTNLGVNCTGVLISP